MTAVRRHKEECGVLVEQKGGGMQEDAKLRKAKLRKVRVCKRLWLKKSHGQAGTRSSGKSKTFNHGDREKPKRGIKKA